VALGKLASRFGGGSMPTESLSSPFDIAFGYRCSNCASDEITVEDEANDDSVVFCRSCGAEFGTWHKFRQLMLKLATAEQAV
jgi:hypothetical protein